MSIYRFNRQNCFGYSGKFFFLYWSNKTCTAHLMQITIVNATSSVCVCMYIIFNNAINSCEVDCSSACVNPMRPNVDSGASPLRAITISINFRFHIFFQSVNPICVNQLISHEKKLICQELLNIRKMQLYWFYWIVTCIRLGFHATMSCLFRLMLSEWHLHLQTITHTYTNIHTHTWALMSFSNLLGHSKKKKKQSHTIYYHSIHKFTRAHTPTAASLI